MTRILAIQYQSSFPVMANVMWNVNYPHLLIIKDNEKVYVTRYATLDEALTVYLDYITRPVEGLSFILE